MDRKAFDEELTSELNKLSLCPDDEQKRQFARFFELLTEWNKRMNLTAVTAQEDVIRRHFADSLSPMALLPDGRSLFSSAEVIDVGSGAGFPGVPLRIMNPAMHLTLLDSQKKRVRFLDEITKELGFEEVRTVAARAEDAGRGAEYREKYDICVSRAVAGMAALAEYCLPFLKIGGEFIAYKSADAHEELERAQYAVTLLGGEIKDVMVFDTPDGGRSLIVIKKKEKTPEKYPRRVGRAVKDPL